MKNILLTVVLLFAVNLGFAQHPQHCATDAINAQMEAVHPAHQRFAESVEADYRQYISAPQQSGRMVRTIPVVVHLIQSSPVGTITDDRVFSQIDVLNEDFRKMNADAGMVPMAFQGVAVDSEIEFCLAKIDPNGCPTTGINRIVSPSNASHVSSASSALKNVIQWDPYRYLNIWVPEEITDGVLGYATFPTWLSFDPGSDGVVVDGQHFGRGNGIPSSTYDQGRTMTHEVGHWLGLFHTFQSGCSGMSQSNCNSNGDNVCDTPPTSGSAFGCPGTRNTCAETFPSDQNDMTMNFMDYVDDRCMHMYSQGQKDRMFFYLDNIRSQVWSGSNLTATGCDGTVSPGCAPVADFTSSTVSACVGNPITFSDLSSGPPTGWSWSFPGGTPATSTSANPQVTYSAPGSYTVTLEATNSLGSNTEVKSGFISVVEPDPGMIQESFEGILLYPQGWYVEDIDGGDTWGLTTTSASDGNNSMVLENFQAPASSTGEALVSVPLDMSNIVGGQLIWDRAYKRFNGFTIDTLRIDVSGDCGNTWNNEWEGAGLSLASVGGIAVSGPFVPSSAQWKSDTLDLGAYDGLPNVRIRFNFIRGGGQNLYIDHLRMDGLVSRAEPSDSDWSFETVNPFQQSLDIRYTLGKPAPMQFRLLDLQGRILIDQSLPLQSAGSHRHILDGSRIESLANGFYILEGRVGNQKVSKKVIKYNGL